MCGRCKSVYYCCREHQAADWKTHKINGNSESPSSLFQMVSTFASFPKASQYGTVRLVSDSLTEGICTDGMSACIAVIFSSAKTGRVSLSHTPLMPSKEALVAEANWIGIDAKMTIVCGSHYNNVKIREQYCFSFVYQAMKDALDGFATVTLDPRIASRGCVAVVRDRKHPSSTTTTTITTYLFNIVVPTMKTNSSQFEWIGYAPPDHEPYNRNLHYVTLMLIHNLENLVSEGLTLLVEFDGFSWLPTPPLTRQCADMVREFKQSGELMTFLRSKVVWSRADGTNGGNCSLEELRAAAARLETDTANYIRLLL